MQVALRLGPLADVEGSLSALLSRAASAGFEGVVLVGLEEPRLRDVAAAIGETGLEPVGAHVPHDRLQAEREAVVRELRTVGCERVIVPALHAAHFEDEAEVIRMATRLSALGGRLAADGRTLCYHNRDHELGTVGERTAYELLAERAGEGLGFEFDAGWAAAAGRDPAALLSGLAGRVPLVDATPRVPETGERRLPGEGELDLAATVEAARAAGTDWLVHVVDEPPHLPEELSAAADVLRSALE